MPRKNKKKNISKPKQAPTVASSNQTSSVYREQKVEYNAPIPPASEMERYAALNPDFASRIIGMAEDEMRHRHELEYKIYTSNIDGSQKALDINKNLKFRSQWFALAVAFGGFAVSIWLAYLGNFIGSTFVGSGAVIGLVSAFLYNKQATKHEQKKEIKK